MFRFPAFGMATNNNNNKAVAPEGLKSSLNPDAPLFIPAALRQVEDFSPEWYELVKTNTWFREQWYSKEREQENDDVLSMLPEAFDLGIENELFDTDGFQEALLHQADVRDGDVAPKDVQKTDAGPNVDGNAVKKTMNGIGSVPDEAIQHGEEDLSASSPVLTTSSCGPVEPWFLSKSF